MLTQDEYQLLTGESASKYSEEYWGRIVNLAMGRLESLLCLVELPFEPEETPDDFKLLLATFICATLQFQGTGVQVQSKSVRNFSVTFSTNDAATVFSNLYANYPDIIDKYSACGNGFAVERTVCHDEDYI